MAKTMQQTADQSRLAGTQFTLQVNNLAAPNRTGQLAAEGFHSGLVLYADSHIRD